MSTTTLLCTICCQQSKRQVEKEVAGRSLSAVEIQRIAMDYPPANAVTWAIFSEMGLPVTLPVCMSHLPYELRSVLAT